MRGRDVAKVYFDVLRDQLREAGSELTDEVAAELAARMDDIVLSRRKVDWSQDTDIQNQMKIAIEDELFAIKKAHDLKIDFDIVDKLLDRLIDVARRRVP